MHAPDEGAATVRRPGGSLAAEVTIVGVAVGIALVGLATGAGSFGRGLAAADVVGAVMVVGLVVLGRRAPLVALALAVVGTDLTVAITREQAVMFIAVVFLLYKVASETNRKTTLIAGGLTIVSLYTVSGPFLEGFSADRDFGFAVWCALALAIGDSVRNRRAYLREVEERALRAERSREEEARRRVVEERLRIARELHDLVAHRMAVINVQAGVASHLLQSRPEEAQQALLTIRSSASEVLGELGEILSVLRSVDDPLAPTEPTPTLRELGGLVESFASAGLEVSWKTSGAMDKVPASVQLALYRLVQEALTNAQRYGDGKASLRVERSASAINVTIANRTMPDPARGSAGQGFGLLGMRERVAAVGGTLEVGPTSSGGFRVSAHLPVLDRASS